MIKTEEKFTYKAFGFSISSYIHFPELLEDRTHAVIADIFIEKTDLSTLWSEYKESNEFVVVKEGFILFRVPEVAIFLIQSGKEIFVSPIGKTDEEQIRLYTLGTCMGALLMQRKILPLHGSAVAIDGKAYAIIGDSGAGKSTLASTFLNKGYQLISDDIIPVTLNNEEIPVVTPTYPQQKLWLESLNQFGMDSRQYHPITVRDTKFAVPVSNQFATAQMQLAGVFELVKSKNEEIEFYPIQKLQRLHTLFKHTYRNSFFVLSDLMQWHFNMSTKIVSNALFYQVRRPNSSFTANELTELILSSINREEKGK